MRKEKQHLTSEGLAQIRQIKAGMNRGRLDSTDLPSSKRFMSTTRNVYSEEGKQPKIELASVVIKPYLYKTFSSEATPGCKGEVAPDNGVYGYNINSFLDICGSREAKEGKVII